MKKLISALLMAAVVPAVANSNYYNFVRQNQLPGNGQSATVIWDMPVVPVGMGISPLSLDSAGSMFQLWTIESASARSFLLDQKLVSTYLPIASITVTTLDPYPRAVRTRVDKPFTVTTKVQGLVPPKNNQKEQSSVLFSRYLGNYPADAPVLNPADVVAGTPFSSAYISANGETTLNFPASQLTIPNVIKATGEEHFTVNVLPGQGWPLTQIASASVQVWPIATGSISGIASGDQLRFQLPQIELILNDLYPRSDTYLLLFKGTTINGQAGTVVASFPLNSETSQSRVVRVPPLDSRIATDGTYTLALVSDTVYGRELLCNSVSFSVRRTLNINAMQTTFSD